MDQSFDSDSTLIKSENEWSEEHDGIPLKQPLKMLLASKHRSDLGDTKTQAEITALPSEDIIVKKEADCISQDLHSTYFLGEGRVESLLLEKCHSGKVLEGGRPRECCIQKIEPNTCNSSNQIVVSEQNCGIVRAEEDITGDVTVNNLASSPVNYLNDSSGAESRAINIKNELPDNIFDDLDHIDLRERRRMLLSRKSLESTKPVGEDSISGLPNFVVDCMHNAVIGNEDSNSIGIECSTEGNCLIKCSTEGIHSDDIPERSAAVFCKNLEFGSSNSMVAGSSNTIPHCPTSVLQSRGTESTRSGNFKNVIENDRMWSSKITSNEFESCGEKDVLFEKHKTVLNSALKTFVNVKVEPLDNNEADKNALDNSCRVNIVPVKSELDFIDAYSVDVIDHMLLRDRMKLLTSFKPIYQNLYAEGSRKIMPSALDFKPILSESATPLRSKRTRKRKKTATDSVETALEEDAPGLLQVLVDKGVVVDEIKLYGQTEIDEALDDSVTEDSFTELEAVISKLFSQRNSLLRLPPVRSTKCEKTSYCLACLISLVEQARYLQFRKWPVEWGWCRDLQSFIFIFERHNRIVLERPEYGYATYFFELLDSVPIDWQIKRLVTAMKLTSCSRVTLIENKALTVGEDLTQGEAAVLTGYGWIPDTGLGTMLNYRDRVVHDRKNEKDNSEWRSKIGKLLMGGYNGGTIITIDIPEKVIEYDVAQSRQIKLEL